MPRKATGKNAQGRLRQQRYRARLAEKREPEVAELDTAAAVAVAQLVVDLEAGLAASGSKDILNRILQSAVADLKSRGFSSRASGPLLHRRLTWLKEVLKNPSADWLTKRGFYDKL
ncbi:hypothetical protein ABIA16_003534 [Sinorhizobium fredii]